MNLVDTIDVIHGYIERESSTSNVFEENRCALRLEKRAEKTMHAIGVVSWSVG